MASYREALSPARLRVGTSEDVDGMYRLDLLCFSEPFRFDPEFMRRCASARNAIVVVAESLGELAGFAIVELRRRGSLTSAYMVTLDVHPEQRRAGLATRLTTEAERRARETGATRISLHVSTENVGAIFFYEAMEYRLGRLREDFYGSGLNAWSYKKLL